MDLELMPMPIVSMRSVLARPVLTALGLMAVMAVALMWPETAQAQLLAPRQEVSMFSAYTGFTNGGDTTGAGANFGVSVAYIAESYWGAEFDLSHSTQFNDAYDESGLTTAMANVMAMPWVTRWVRPYAVFGAGAIRARGCGPNCVTEFSRTDLGLDAGGGVLVPFNHNLAARGDVRYFRYAQIHKDLPRLDNGAFDFWRISFGGVIAW
jgi:opacity protein-like surface antigen